MVSEFECFEFNMHFSFFTVAEVKEGHRPTQTQHRFPESLLLTKKSYPTSSGQNNQPSSPLGSQSILMASLLKPSDTKDGAFSRQYNTPDSFREGFETRDVEETSNDQILSNDKEIIKVLPTQSQFSHHYNTPDSFREGVETGDEDAFNLTPDLFTKQYNTPDTFRKGIESRDINMVETGKQTLMSPDVTLHDSNDDNEIPGDNSGMFLGFQDRWTIPEDEILPEEFLDHTREESNSRLSPELQQRVGLYYDTDSRFYRVPAVDTMSMDNDQKHRGDSEGRAYTEGGLVYLPKQNRGKKIYESK